MHVRFGSVCSGIEAASTAWHPLGWQSAWFAEVAKFPSRVLKHHYPDVPNLGDMLAIDADDPAVNQIDVLVGGTPCQAFSVAGYRKSLDDERGNLTLAFCRLARRIADHGRLKTIVWENVHGVLGTKDNAFGCFLAGLVGEDVPLVPSHGAGNKWTNAGAVYGPQASVAWRTLDAQFFGLAQRRKRVFVVCCLGAWADPGQILFEFEGVRRDSPPRREAGQETAGTLACRTTGGGGLGTDFELDGGIVAMCLNGGGMGRIDSETETLIVTHSLKAEGFDASEDGTGRSIPLVPTCYRISGNCGAWDTGETTNAITTATDPSSTVLAGDQRGVRRLTPTEAERLMGFPDNYTAIPKGADGPRYKALGNSMAVPCMQWIGSRIATALNQADRTSRKH